MTEGSMKKQNNLSKRSSQYTRLCFLLYDDTKMALYQEVYVGA